MYKKWESHENDLINSRCMIDCPNWPDEINLRYAKDLIFRDSMVNQGTSIIYDKLSSNLNSPVHQGFALKTSYPHWHETPTPIGTKSENKRPGQMNVFNLAYIVSHDNTENLTTLAHILTFSLSLAQQLENCTLSGTHFVFKTPPLVAHCLKHRLTFRIGTSLLKYSRTPLQRTPTGPGLPVRPTGVLFAQGGVFKQDLTEKIFGTDQNCSLKRGVRLTRVFVRRGSTVYRNTIEKDKEI